MISNARKGTMDGWSLDVPTGISGDGSTIVGWGLNNGNLAGWRASIGVLFCDKRGNEKRVEKGRSLDRQLSRGATLDVARQLGLEIREANLGRYEALLADEIFCTATTYSLVHAHTFEGQLIGDGQPGPIFRRLLGGWKELAGVDFVAQAHEYATRLPEWLERDARRAADP